MLNKTVSRIVLYISWNREYLKYQLCHIEYMIVKQAKRWPILYFC